MEAITIHSRNKEQLTALKVILKEMKIPYEPFKEAKIEESPYDPEYVAKIKRSQKQAREGKGKWLLIPLTSWMSYANRFYLGG